ncbi:MAG: nucleoside triphosphate pyrophosphatase [bacterium]
MKKIILASSSPRRKTILGLTGLDFTIDVGDYEEDMTLNMSPKDLAIHLSRGKAESVIARNPDSIVIAADTFCVLEGKLLGKPKTPERAKTMLASLSGTQHAVISGVTIVDTASGQKKSWAEVTTVHFRPITESEINAYVATGEALDKAGAYAFQEKGGIFVEKIIGDYYNVIGLPLCSLVQSLKDFGVECLSLDKSLKIG